MQYLTHIPSASSGSSVTFLSIMLMKMSKSVRARTQPRFTPFVMENGSGESPIPFHMVSQKHLIFHQAIRQRS